jgi:hypothetical protein
MRLSAKDRERTKQLEGIARQLGFSFEVKDGFGMRAYFKDMKLFRIGGAPKSLNMIHKKDDEMNNHGMFDYHYTVSTGKSSYTYKQTVYFRIHNELMLPEFRLFPERWHHQIGKWFGVQDINFIAYPEFSRNYLLQGPQPDFIWKLFQEEKLINHCTTHIGWSVEAVGKYLVMYMPNKIIQTPDMKKCMKTGDALYNLLIHRNREMESIFSYK